MPHFRLLGQALRRDRSSHGDTKKQREVGLDRGIAYGYRGVVASFALQVEHRNLNVKLGPIWPVSSLSLVVNGCDAP